MPLFTESKKLAPLTRYAILNDVKKAYFHKAKFQIPFCENGLKLEKLDAKSFIRLKIGCRKACCEFDIFTLTYFTSTIQPQKSKNIILLPKSARKIC